MPQIIEPPTRTMPPASLPRIRWNVEQFDSLAASDLLTEKGCELIEGDVIQKISIGNAHSYVISLLFAFFGPLAGFKALRSQFSLFIDRENLPEPDFAILNRPDPILTERGYIQTPDIRLLIEVSDATLARDLTIKAALYARAGVPEYWVIDVTGRRLLIHGTPGTDGYTQVTEYSDTDSAAPLFDPTAVFAVSDILP